VIKFPRAGLAALLLLSLIAVCGDAYELSGRISSDFYSYQSADQDHLRPYLRFNGNLLAWESADGRSLRIHSSVRWTSDFSDQLWSDPQLFVRDLYAHLSQVIPRSDLYLGRQFVYNGVGSALIDGGRVRIRPIQAVTVDFFGGSSVSSEDPETVRSLDDNLVVGARLGARPDRASRLGLNWMWRRREGQTSVNRIGLDADRRLGRAEVFGRVAYNAADLRLAEILGRAMYRAGKWYVSGEYMWREPSVASSSMFSLVDFDRYSIGRLEARRTVWRDISILAHVQTDLSDGNDSWRTGLGLAGRFYSLSYTRQSGDGGDSDGLSGYLNLRITPRWECYANANLNQYRVQEEQGERSDAYASTFGVRWKAGRGVSVRSEIQYLGNAVSDGDVRFLLRINKSFSISSNKGAAQ